MSLQRNRQRDILSFVFFAEGSRGLQVPDKSSEQEGSSAPALIPPEPDPLLNQISRFFTSSALSSINFRRASTSSPISVVKTVSHSARSSSFTDNNVRRSGSIVVSQSCCAVISPKPL